MHESVQPPKEEFNKQNVKVADTYPAMQASYLRWERGEAQDPHIVRPKIPAIAVISVKTAQSTKNVLPL